MVTVPGADVEVSDPQYYYSLSGGQEKPSSSQLGEDCTKEMQLGF